jgi:nucleoside-diphosphate-sugar epimerase
MVGEVLGEAGIPWIVLRLAGLYGPGRDLGRIYRVHPSRVLAGDGMRPTNLIHVDDAVSAVLAALAQPASTSGVIHVCDDEHTPRREMYARVAAAMGGPAPSWAEEAAPDARPVGKRVDNTKMKRILGVELAYPAHMLQVSDASGSPSG